MTITSSFLPTSHQGFAS